MNNKTENTKSVKSAEKIEETADQGAATSGSIRKTSPGDQNGSLTVEITSAEGLSRKLAIETAAETVDLEFEKEYRKIQKSITLKGFRRGHAPLKMIRNMYGSQVRGDVLERLVSDGFRGAVQILELNVATPPTVRDVKMGEGQPLTFTAELEVFPEINDVDTSNLWYLPIPVTADENEIDETLEGLRIRFAEMEDVSRPIEDGDIVTVDMDKLEDKDNILEGDSFPDSTIDLGNKTTLEEFRVALVGANRGDEREADITYPEDYPDRAFSGKSLKYKLTVKKTQMRHIPELNDEFAVKCGGAETVAGLRQRIRQGIRNTKEAEEKKRRNSSLISQLISANQIDTPQGLVDEYLNKVVEDFRKNTPPEQFDEEKIREHYQEVGVSQLRWRFLGRKLVAQAEITAKPEDIQEWIDRFADERKTSSADARKALARGGRMEDVRQSILEEKLLEYLANLAKEGEPSTIKSQKKSDKDEKNSRPGLFKRIMGGA